MDSKNKAVAVLTKGIEFLFKKNKIKYNKNYYLSVKTESPEQSAVVIKKMLIKCPEISALICSTEYSGVGAIKACNDLNKKIGKDIINHKDYKKYYDDRLVKDVSRIFREDLYRFGYSFYGDGDNLWCKLAEKYDYYNE